MWLRPTYFIDGDVTNIDLNKLHADGIRGIIFDLDSTLMAPHSGVISDEVAFLLEKTKGWFKVAVVSNNKKMSYIEQIRSILDMIIIGHAAKPSRRGFLEALKMMELQPSQVAVVGDRPLTDIWGGQRAGMKTVLVWPLKTMQEPEWITFCRKLERLIIKT